LLTSAHLRSHMMKRQSSRQRALLEWILAPVPSRSNPFSLNYPECSGRISRSPTLLSFRVHQSDHRLAPPMAKIRSPHHLMTSHRRCRLFRRKMSLHQH
jgi:hypothetical protein